MPIRSVWALFVNSHFPRPHQLSAGTVIQGSCCTRRQCNFSFLNVLKKIKSAGALFSTVRTFLPLLVLALEIISFIHDKLQDYASKNLKAEEGFIGS